MAATCLACLGSGDDTPQALPGLLGGAAACGRCGGSGLDPDPAAEWRVDLLRIDDPADPSQTTTLTAASVGAAMHLGRAWLAEVVCSRDLECGVLFQRTGWGPGDWRYVTDLDLTPAEYTAARLTW